MKIMYNVYEKIRETIKKYKFRKRTYGIVAVNIALLVITEMFLTSMSHIDRYRVEIRVDGEEISCIADGGTTIEELLRENGIIIGEHDEVNLPLTECIERETEIMIDRVEYIDVSISSRLDYETIYEESSLYKMGTEFVSQEGKIGCRITTNRQKLVNGKITESVEIGVEEYAPVAEIITVGTAHNEPYSKKTGDFRLENGVPTEYAYMVSGKVTAYTAPPGSGTYSGRTLEIGTVAVNPDIIPFGSELYICSKDGKRVYGYAIAADTGDLTEVVADVFMGLTSEHYSDACAWGAQDSYVYVLTVGDNSVSWM